MFYKIEKFRSLILLMSAFYLSHVKLHAQISVEQNVIGATGDFDSIPGGNFNISSTIGEAVINTVSGGSPAFILTQGFHQPIVNEEIELQAVVKSETCIGAYNGVISINVLNSAGPFTYSWQPNTLDTSATVANLTSGVYMVTVTDIINGNTATDTIQLGSESSEVCGLIIYSGLTPNEDGKNDTWVIDRILDFPTNRVYIFNRWGEEVWRGNSYDNATVVWTGQDKAKRDLPDGTYFYYIKTIPREYKGWIELTR